MDDEKEIVRKTALQIIKQRNFGYVLSEDISIVGISHASAAAYLNHNYGEWGLDQVEDKACKATIKRHKYVMKRTPSRSYPFKCDMPCIPDLARLFGEERIHSDPKIIFHESLKTAIVKAELSQKTSKENTDYAAQETFHKAQENFEKVQERLKAIEGETMPQKIKRIIDDLHTSEPRVNLVKIIHAVEKETGRRPDMDMKTEIAEIYNQGIRAGKYQWSKGFSSRNVYKS
jgi:hypothetical protein